MSEDVQELAAQARGIIADARAWVAEWLEEGIDGFERAPAAQQPAQAARTAAAVPTEVEHAHRAPTAPARSAPPAAARRSSQPEPMHTAADVPTRGGVRSKPGDAPTLEAVRAELGECTRCGLSNGRQHIVFGDGNPDADILFVGEGPGQTEDERGLPFVGRAGELLTQMIEKGMGIARSDVYICNIVKCRPPENRNPLPDEVAACRPFLDGQIAAVKPKVIVALGKPAAGLLLGRDVAITRIRGTWHDYRGIPLMPTLHPAYVLRQYTAENRRAVWEDLKAALARAREAGG